MLHTSQQILLSLTTEWWRVKDSKTKAHLSEARNELVKLKAVFYLLLGKKGEKCFRTSTYMNIFHPFHQQQQTPGVQVPGNTGKKHKEKHIKAQAQVN